MTAGCSGAAGDGVPINRIVTAEVSPRIDAVVLRLLRRGEPGIGVAVTKAGKIVHMAGYGYADLDRDLAINRDTKFHIGSTGKQFTALAMLLLADEGLVDLDAPAARYLPELQAKYPRVLVHQLLDHTSGLGSYYPGEGDIGWGKLKVEMARAKLSAPTNTQAVAAIAQVDPVAAPGTRWAYSNVAFETAAALIERVTGRTYQDFVAERVLRPLGMSGTFLTPDLQRSAQSDVARGYEFNGGEQGPFTRRSAEKFKPVDPATHQTRRLFDGLSGAGTIYTSLDDMVAYDRAWDRGMPLVSGEARRRMLTPAAAGPVVKGMEEAHSYGFGLSLVRDVKQMEPLGAIARSGGAILHTGGWPGFSALYMRFPRQRVGVIVLINRDSLYGDMGAAWNRPTWTLLLDSKRQRAASTKLGWEIAKPFL